MFILEVIPIARSSHTDTLSYFSVKEVVLGGVVEVPLRKQNILAVVVGVNPVTNIKSQIKSAEYSIRNIHNIIDGHLYSSNFLQTTHLIKNYFCVPQGQIINFFSPKFLQNEKKLWKKRVSYIKRKRKVELLMRPFAERIDYYKLLIREKKTEDESIIIFCPSTHECEMLFSELSKNTPHVYCLHSKISKKKRIKLFTEIIERERSSVVITTPSFIDIPLVNLTTIIVEHESSPYYIPVSLEINVRKVIELFAYQATLDVIYADTILRPELWQRQIQRKADVIEPFQGVLRKLIKQIDIEKLHLSQTEKISDKDRIEEIQKMVTEFKTLSNNAHALISKNIKENKNTFIYASRKSLAPSIVCNDCGNLVVSKTTNRPYSLFNKKGKSGERERVFKDPLTKEIIPAFDTCHVCRGNRLVQLGIGTERIYSDIQSYKKSASLFIIDDNHKLLKKELAALSKAMKSTSHPVIVVGTRKAFSIVEKFDSSIISSLDSILSRPSPYTVTDMLWVLSTIVRMTNGSVHIQSRNISASQLNILTTGRYKRFINKELLLRKDLGLPPFGTCIQISKEIQKNQLKDTHAFIKNIFTEYPSHIEVISAKNKSKIKIQCELSVPRSSWDIHTQDTKLLQTIRELSHTWNIKIIA